MKNIIALVWEEKKVPELTYLVMSNRKDDKLPTTEKSTQKLHGCLEDAETELRALIASVGPYYGIYECITIVSHRVE